MQPFSPDHAIAEPSISPDDTSPLLGMRVLDFTRYVSGPYCTMLMADAGAEVIKIEPPGGETSRHLEPFVDLPEGPQISTYYLRFNRGKKSVVLDPRNPDDRPDLIALIEAADVIVENFRPGALDAWGLGWERLQQLNPGLVYASISGFGHSAGRCRDWPAFNLVAEVMAGVVSQLPSNGKPARAAGLPVGDSVTSLHALSGILMALLRRARTGQGSRVDIAMYDSMLSLNEWSIGVQSGAGVEVEIGREVHPWFAPYGLFQASDGWLCICVATDHHWRLFCAATGMDDLASDPLLADGIGRAECFGTRIKPRLVEWLGTHTAESAADVLTDHGVPAAPLQRAAQLLDCDQAAARQMIVDLPFDEWGRRIRLAGNPIRVEPRRSPVAEGFAAVGAHTHEVLDQLRAGDDRGQGTSEDNRDHQPQERPHE